MVKVNMTVKGLTVDKLDKTVKNIAPRVIRDSTKFAMNKVVITARSRAVKSISAASNVKPLKLIRQRTSIFKAKKNRLAVGIYFKSAQMPLEFLAGKAGPKWNRNMVGASVRGKKYPGTFVGTPRSGRNANLRERVYRRTRGPKRDNHTDLRAIYVQLKPYEPILAKVANRVVAQRLEKEFITQFEYRMKKAGF